MEDIARESSALGVSFDYYHSRTSGGVEIDLDLEADFGTDPIEIKMAKISQRSLSSIKVFIAEWSCPYGLVINNDECVRLYDNRFVDVPFWYNIL